MKSSGQPTEVHAPQTIVVAVDADALSDDAIGMGAQLGRAFGARVDFVHAIPAGLLGTQAVEDPRRISDESDLALIVEKRLLAHVRSVLAANAIPVDAAVVLHVEAGLPARVLIDHARKAGADLLVLGTLRKRSVLDFGSTARAVLAKSPCPVLVQPLPPRAVRRILVAFDHSSEARLALSTALHWARRLGARVQVLHCFDTTSLTPGSSLAGVVVAGAVPEISRQARTEFEREMAAWAFGEIEHEATFVEGVPATQILDAAQAADLIVMGTHGRGGFAAALLGSVAYAVLKHTPTSTMVVRDPRRTFTA